MQVHGHTLHLYYYDSMIFVYIQCIHVQCHQAELLYQVLIFGQESVAQD